MFPKHRRFRLYAAAAFGLAGVLACAQITFASQLSASRLLGYWKLDETSGTTAADASGNANGGSLTNSPTISSTVPTTVFANVRSLQFHGAPTKDYVSTTLTRPTSGTISLWAYPTSYADWISPAGWKLLGATNGYTLIDEGGSGTPGKWRAVYKPDNSGNAEADVAASASITQNAWTHLAMTWSVSGTTHTVTLYVNGTSQGTASWTGTPGAGGFGGFNMGKAGDYDDNYFIGNVDDVRVYGRALSAAEIADLAAGKHTAAVWNGGADNSFEHGSNWDTGAVPDRYTRVTVLAATHPLSLTGAIQFSGLTVNTGALLIANGQNLTMNDSGVFTNEGTLGMRNTETLSSLTLPVSQGTVMLVGSGITTGLAAGNSYFNLTLNDGLVGYWKLDEASGARAADSSGYGNSGALVNTPTVSTTAAPVNFADARSLGFNGTNQYVTMGDPALLQPNNLSVSAWFNTTNSGFQDIVRKRFYGYSLYMDNGQVGTDVWENTSSLLSLTSTNTYDDGQWHHLALTYDGTTLRQYIDGVQTGVETGAGTNGIGYFGGAFAIARDGDSDGGYFLGNIDDVRVYNRALSAAEVANLAAGNEPHAGLGTVTLNAALTVNGSLTLHTGTLDASSSNYAITVKKSWMNNGGKIIARAGTVTLGGTSAGQSVQTGGQPFYNLTVGTAGLWNLNDALSLSGSLALNAGTLSASGRTVSVAGNWTKGNAATFNANGNTVILNGQNQTLSGSTTFYDLTKLPVSAASLSFLAGSTQTVTDALILKGAGASSLLTLQSTSPGTAWTINIPATRTVGYVSLTDSVNTGPTVVPCATNSAWTCANGGNNVRWVFSTTGPTGSTSTGGGGGGSGGSRGKVVNTLPAVSAPASVPPLFTGGSGGSSGSGSVKTLHSRILARRQARLHAKPAKTPAAAVKHMPLPASPLPVSAEFSSLQKNLYRVTSSSLKLRAQASMQAPVVTTALHGQMLTVTGVSLGWAQVVLPSGRTVYAAAKYVQKIQ